MKTFVDYAWWQVSPVQLASMGFSGAMRYGVPGNTKSATAVEVANLRAAGFDFGLVYETVANRSAQGTNAGADDAKAANVFADSLGYPSTCTLWYAVDFDAAPSQVQAYFDGVGSARLRTYAPYGSADVIDGVRYPGIGWQTAAWSRGRVSARAGLLQNGFHNTYDSNVVLVADFGQWRAGTIPTPTPTDVPVAVLEEGMFTSPPDAKAHDFPVPSWAKKLRPLSNGTSAKVAITDGKNVLALHDRDYWGPNLSFAMDIPAGAQCVEVVNWGSGQEGSGSADLNVIFDIA